MRPLRYVPLALLLLTSAAFADSIPWFFGNSGGTLTFDPATQTLTLTSTITTLIAVGQYTGANLGTITVTTGPLISGSITSHGIFSDGTITISSVSINGLDSVGLSGTLVSPLIWYESALKPDEFFLAGHGYALVNGVPTPIWDFEQSIVLTSPNQFNVVSGKTVIPEPGTMALVATGLGLLAWAGMIRDPSFRITRREETPCI